MSEILQLKAVKGSGDTLLDWASEALQSRMALLLTISGQHSGKGKILWFLDGLDEIVDQGERLTLCKSDR